jgi:hypothetical protein
MVQLICQRVVRYRERQVSLEQDIDPTEDTYAVHEKAGQALPKVLGRSINYRMAARVSHNSAKH